MGGGNNFWLTATLLGVSCILIIAKFRGGKTYRGA
jgi:hypothetical protein